MARKIINSLLICFSVTTITFFGVLLYWRISENKKYLVRKANADIILTGSKLEECIAESCPTNNCITQEDWQNAYYKMFGTKTSCAVALYKMKLKYLKGKVPFPRHSKCYHRFDTEFFKQEGLDYKELKHKYLTNTKLPPVKPNTGFKIPQKLNFVWFTSKKEFLFKKNAFFKINSYIFHNTRITPTWKHTLWTNNINWITEEAKKKLSIEKIELKPIDDLNITNQKHEKLRYLSKQYALQHRWGIASDIARDLVEYYEGGIYVDGDYKLLQPMELEKYMKSYTSFFGINDFNSSSKDFFEIINAFIASEPKGTVLEKKLDLNYRNIVGMINAPNYIKYPCHKASETLFKTGPVALTVAFDLNRTALDIVLPYCSLFMAPNDFITCLTARKFGKHYFHGGWMKGYPGMRQILVY